MLINSKHDVIEVLSKRLTTPHTRALPFYPTGCQTVTSQTLCVTGYRKRAHFAQESIFQYEQLKVATTLDFVHDSECLKC